MYYFAMLLDDRRCVTQSIAKGDDTVIPCARRASSRKLVRTVPKLDSWSTSQRAKLTDYLLEVSDCDPSDTKKVRKLCLKSKGILLTLSPEQLQQFKVVAKEILGEANDREYQRTVDDEGAKRGGLDLIFEFAVNDAIVEIIGTLLSKAPKTATIYMAINRPSLR